MVEVIHLPAQPVPKRETVHYRPKSLGEHLMAFLNSNNKRGFADESDSDTWSDGTPFEMDLETAESFSGNAVADLFIMLATKDSVTLREFLDTAGTIRNNTKKKIRITHAMEMLARLFGYRNYHALYFHAWSKVLGGEPTEGLSIAIRAYTEKYLAERLTPLRFRNNDGTFMERYQHKERTQLLREIRDSVIIENRRDKSMVNMRLIQEAGRKED